MQYPLISEYLAAIQDAHDNLDKLNHLVPVLDKHGEPYRSSGAFAVVFKMKDEQTGKCYALKCFTEEQEGRAEAYRQIAEELEFVDSPYITSVKYLEKELFVDSNCENDEFPVLLMDWIEGETMETYIAENYTDSYEMSMLCYRFCKMAAWLRSQSFAHGDIKPDNIIVRPDGTLTLVDYDGMFVPAMKGQKSPTIGTKDFSHPLRTIDDFDETIDDFALASIALSLKAIALDSSLLQSYGASDRLLFSATDYLDLSKSKIFAALQDLLADVEARTLLSMFLLASAQKDLSMCSFRLFGLQKPKEKEVWSTEVTDEDFKNAIKDEYGVKYSKDWKRILKAPEDLDGVYSIRKGVKVIAKNAFLHCLYLDNINIPNSVISIGSNAFKGCWSLKSINIPESVTCIEDYAFAYCNSLKSINMPESVTTIGKGAFCNCNSLKSINIPESVTSIGEYAFSHCNSLTSINIPDGVTSIGDSAFRHCNSLKSINIPDGVTSIGYSAFYNCNSLKSINIPESVTCIEDHAFAYCNFLTSINIPDGVTTIGKGAFSNCNSLKSINIPDGVTSIGYSAFINCNSLKSINIPGNVTTIGEGAFCNCNSLKSINMPESVTTIGKGAFCNCNSLKSIKIPDGVTSIGYNAFSNCNSLTSINIPDGVATIKDYTFAFCTSLKSITIPSSVVTIGDNPFIGCHADLHNKSKAFVYEDNVLFNKDKTTIISYRSKETSYIIPDSVTSIGTQAFRGNESLKNIIIPNSVTSIGTYAFALCTSLKSITIPSSVVAIDGNPFCGCHADVFNESKAFLYEENVLFNKDKTTLISYRAKETNYTIPTSVTRIGKNAFGRCETLKSITIPNSVTTIGRYALVNCTSLTSINIPESVTSIEMGAFYGCDSLPSQVKSNIIQRFGKNVF